MRKYTKMNNKKYNKLIEEKKKKKISLKNSKLLDKELEKRYCRCIKKLKQTKKTKKTKKSKGSEYPICLTSVYINRKFAVPKDIKKKCKK